MLATRRPVYYLYPGVWSIGKLSTANVQMNIANVGLVCFVVIVALDATGLLIDLVRVCLGWPTITMGLINCPVLGFLVAVMQFVGAAGFFAHLYARG